MFTSCTCCRLAIFGMYMWAQLESAACEAGLKQCSHVHSIPTGTVSQMTKSINPIEYYSCELLVPLSTMPDISNNLISAGS